MTILPFSGLCPAVSGLQITVSKPLVRPRNMRDRNLLGVKVPRIGVMHRGHLSAHTDKTTSGQIFARSIDQLLYLIRHISQVFTFGPSVNVDDRPDIIVILNRRGGSARNRGHIGHNLGLSRSTPENGKVSQTQVLGKALIYD